MSAGFSDRMDVGIEEREEVGADNLFYLNTKKTKAIQSELLSFPPPPSNFICILLNLFCFPVIMKRQLFYLRPTFYLCCGSHLLLPTQRPHWTNYSMSYQCLQFLCEHVNGL